MKMDEQQLKQMYYEQSVQHYGRESDLLFRRLDFFLLGMSFLVAAFVYVITLDKVNVSLANTILILGGVLSLIFFIVNFYNSRNVLKKMLDYMFIIEHQLGMPNEEMTTPCDLKPPLLSALPRYDPERNRTGECCLINFIKDHPGVFTWFIPLLFTFFWPLARFLF